MVFLLVLSLWGLSLSAKTREQERAVTEDAQQKPVSKDAQ